MYQLFIVIEEEGYERFFRSYGVESFRNLPILSNSSIIIILRQRGIILSNLGYNIYNHDGPVCSLVSAIINIIARLCENSARHQMRFTEQ